MTNKIYWFKEKQSMSTPLREIMPDIETEDEDGLQMPGTMPAGSVSTSGSIKKYAKYKEYLFLFLAAFIALKIPFASIAYRLPSQLLSFGDIPLKSLLIVFVYLLQQQVIKMIAF